MDFHLVPRGTDRNYTGFLTKTIVYASTLLLFLAGTLNLMHYAGDWWRLTYHSIRPDNLIHRRPEMGQLS